MPTFKFLNTETGEEFEDFLSNTRKEELLSKNPHIRQLPSLFTISTMTGSMDTKTDNTWKEVLSKVADAHPESPVGQRYGRKSIKQVKTRQTVDKHLGNWRVN